MVKEAHIQSGQLNKKKRTKKYGVTARTHVPLCCDALHINCERESVDEKSWRETNLSV